MSCAETATGTDRDAVSDAESRGSREPCIIWDHIGATWRIRLNWPCAAALCQITLTTLCGFTVHAAECRCGIHASQSQYSHRTLSVPDVRVASLTVTFARHSKA